MNVQQILELIAKNFGWQVGDKVRVEIEKVLKLQDVDTKDLEDKIKVIQGILDADPETEEFDVAQNIITQLKDQLDKITVNQKAIAQNANAIKDLQDQCAACKDRIKALEDKDVATASDLDDLKKVVATKASQDDLDALAEKVKTKASQDDLDALAKTVATKASQDDLDALSKKVDTKASQDDLDATNRVVATKASQDDLDAANKAIATKASQDDLDATNKVVATKADKTYVDSTFVTKKEVSDVDVAKLTELFRAAMDCGYDGTALEDCKAAGEGSASGSASANGSSDGEAL